MIASTRQGALLMSFGFARPRPLHALSMSVTPINATPSTGLGWIGGTGVDGAAVDRAYCPDLGTGAIRGVANHRTAAVTKQDRPPRGAPR